VGRTCSTQWEMENRYRILVGIRDGKRPHGRTRCGWEDNIKIDLKDTVVRSFTLTNSFQLRVLKSIVFLVYNTISV